MPKKTVQDLILQKLDNLEQKVDAIATKALPKVVTDVAIMKAEAVTQAATTSRIHGTVWGVVTLLVSVTGIAIAYFSN